jgi:hypothetical protein
MKKLNTIKFFVMTGAILLGLSACGSNESSQRDNIENKEPSSNEVAIEIPVEISEQDTKALTLLDTYNTTTYRKAEWIPEDSTQPTSKTSSINQTTVLKSNKPFLKSIQKVESNGENTTDWSIYSGSITEASISTVYDTSLGSDVIELNGNGKSNGYVIGYSFQNGSNWNDKTNRTIKWSMNFKEEYMIYVRISTKNGYRYLYYTPTNQNNGISDYEKPHYIHNGLGITSKNGTWQTVTRNLTADLKRFEALNEIISVDGFFVRGSGRIDNLELLKTNTTIANEVIYEDAEDGEDSRWSVYDNRPIGATINNVYDSVKASKVIQLQGDGKKNGYILGAWDAKNGWKNTINKEFSVDVKYAEDFVIYISVITAKGHRFITYSPTNPRTFNRGESGDRGIVKQGGYTYIHLGLNPNTKDGTWRTISRNLENDLKKYEPNNQLVAINAFLIRGSGCVDDIKTFDTNEPSNPIILTGAIGGN